MNARGRRALVKALALDLVVFIWAALLVCSIWLGLRFLEGNRRACMEDEAGCVWPGVYLNPSESPTEGR